jgi:hypothetical protein
MALKHRLKRLQKAARGQLASFELAGGSRYHFDPGRAHRDLFTFWCDSLKSVHHGTPRPEPPEILEAVVRARKREAALRAIFPEGVAMWLPLEEGALVEHGEFVPRYLTAGRLPETS